MLSASLVDTRTVRLDGLKLQWRITKSEDVVMIDGGEAFIRMSPCSTGLSSLVAAENPTVPEPAPKHLLSASLGLASLIAMRNQKQADALSAEDGGCSLFEKIPKKRRVFFRRQQKALRKAPESITIEIEIHGTVHEVHVLRPVHPNDNFFVAYKSEMVAAVVHYVRGAGFKDTPSRVQSDLPAGVHRRKDGFVVKYEKPFGSVGYKFQKTLDEAVAFQADVRAEHEAHDAIGGDSSQDGASSDGAIQVAAGAGGSNVD